MSEPFFQSHNKSELQRIQAEADKWNDIEFKAQFVMQPVWEIIIAIFKHLFKAL